MPFEQPASATPLDVSRESSVTTVATYPGRRVLAWAGDVLYASCGYTLLKARITGTRSDWQTVGRFRPAWWRELTSANRLSARLVRDGFHALAVLPSGHLVAAVPGAIVTLRPGDSEFRISHTITRGTRPLHVMATPEGNVLWGEYFDNARREEVRVYASRDCGESWEVGYTFPKGAIRHVHNVVYDEWEKCLWILTGDYGAECRILRAGCNFRSVEPVLSGNQQARAVALVPSAEGLHFSSDTPLEKNHVFLLDRQGKLTVQAELSSSSIYGCRVGNSLFFSTMVEPSKVNAERRVRVYAGHGGARWQPVLEWKKDRWPMRLLQYGNAILPDGENTTDYLAVTTIAVEGGDLMTAILRVGSERTQARCERVE